MLAITMAPAGGRGALPLLVGVEGADAAGAGLGTGAWVGVAVPEPPDPAELDGVELELDPPATGVVDEGEMPEELPSELVNCVVVVPGDLVRLFVPPHPVTQNAAML